MTNKLLCVIVILCMLMTTLSSHAQLSINGASFTIESGATVTVQGNLNSNVDIGGAGTVIMHPASATAQTITTNGFTIPNLKIDNTANVSLVGNTKVGSTLTFASGKLLVGDFTLTLASGMTSSGAAAGTFIETNGLGQVKKELTANVTNYEVPVGAGTNYEPVFLTANGTYSSAFVGIQAKGASHPNKHPRSTDFLNVYWPITQSGITGTLRATGKYSSNFTGTESDLRGIIYTNNDWSLANTNINTTADTTGALIPAAGADLYAMNRFVLLKNKVFLQGCYNSSTGLMNDNLRTLASFPTTDPYRTAPYNTYFTHTNNTIPETISSPATVLGTQAVTDNNIVDWVFIELRNTASPGNTILQTRSALLQRDGDIVDVDGVSPIYFKNVDAGNYTIAIRHRNHLGLSTNPLVFTPALDEKNNGPLVDMTAAAATSLFGTATTNYVVSNGKNLLYAGNVSGNGFVRYQGNNGPGTINISDRVALLSDLGNNEINVLSTYQRGDVNLNGFTRYQGNNGPGVFNVSDRVFLLGTVLGNDELITRVQALPN